MRVYKKHESNNFTYPDEMKRILDYLDEHGTLFVNSAIVEKLYFIFSEEKYCASWMIVNDHLLEQFADWLDNYDIERRKV